MRCFVFALLVAAVAAPAALQAQSAPGCLPTTTLDELTAALDAAVSGPANGDRACLRELMLPEARLAPIAATKDGGFAPHLLTVDEWIAAVAKRGSAPFYEVQVKVEPQVFQHLAHLWCHYEIRSTPDGPATVTGINSIQAVNDGKRWRILSVLWEPLAEKK